MSSSKDLNYVITWFLVAAMATAVLLYLLSTDQFNGGGRVLSLGVGNNTVNNNNPESSRTQELMGVLRNASSKDGTVIITALNEAWIDPGSIFDIFLESFRIGEETEQLLEHLVVVAMDQKAFDKCKSIHKHCYFLFSEGADFSSQKTFMSHDYLEMMWKRLEFMKNVLELGYNFVFSDTDIVWLRNPFSRFPNNTDLAIASDAYYGDPSDHRNLANCGFVYVKSNVQTIQFYKYWLMNRGAYPPGTNEQAIFNFIKRDCYASRLKLKVGFLDTAYIGGYCQSSRDFNKICTLHANCCIGVERKIHDLTNLLQDWRNYKAKTKEEKEAGSFPCCAPKECRLF